MKGQAQVLPSVQARGFFDEIQKVSWPTRAETVRLTLIVVAVSLVVGLYVGVLDVVLAQALKWLTT